MAFLKEKLELRYWFIYVKRIVKNNAFWSLIPFFPEDLENVRHLTNSERLLKVVLFQNNVDRLHLWIA